MINNLRVANPLSENWEQKKRSEGKNEGVILFILTNELEIFHWKEICHFIFHFERRHLVLFWNHQRLFELNHRESLSLSNWVEETFLAIYNIYSKLSLEHSITNEIFSTFHRVWIMIHLNFERNHLTSCNNQAHDLLFFLGKWDSLLKYSFFDSMILLLFLLPQITTQK